MGLYGTELCVNNALIQTSMRVYYLESTWGQAEVDSQQRFFK